MTPPWSAEMALDFGRFQIESHADFAAHYIAGNADTVAIIPCMENPHETAMMLALSIAAGKLPSVDWLILACDTFSTTFADPADVPDDLERAFLSGDPRVIEALSIYCLAPDGPSYIANQHYRRISDTNGLVEWDEPTVDRDTDNLAGPIMTAMGLVLSAPSGTVPGVADAITAVVFDPETPA